MIYMNLSNPTLSAAMRTGALVRDDGESVVGLARDLAEASGRRADAGYVCGGVAFDPALSVADCDLVSLADTLDPASARRFTLRAEFAALDTARGRQLYGATFGHDAPCALDRIGGLTPGDFVQAGQRARLLDEARPSELVGWLRDAIEARDGIRAPKGFRAV